MEKTILRINYSYCVLYHSQDATSPAAPCLLSGEYIYYITMNDDE